MTGSLNARAPSAGAGTGDTLSRTGTNTATPLLIGVALVAGGLALSLSVLAGRRRVT